MTIIIRQGHFNFHHWIDVWLFCIYSKNEVCRFNRIWDMDNCLKKTWMTSSPIWFLLNLNTNRPRLYLSDISNFILIEHKRAEIQSREVNRELWRKKGYYVTVTLTFDLWPKVTNFNRLWANAVCNRLAKTASKSVHPFNGNFVHKQSWTDRQTDTHTRDKLQWKYNPSTISWRCYRKHS